MHFIKRCMQKPLWIPSQEFINSSEMKRFEDFVSEKYAQSFNSYHEFWQWSIDNLSDFWEAIFLFFQVKNLLKVVGWRGRGANTILF